MDIRAERSKPNRETGDDLSDLKAAMDYQTLAHFLNLTHKTPPVRKAKVKPKWKH